MMAKPIAARFRLPRVTLRRYPSGRQIHLSAAARKLLMQDGDAYVVVGFDARSRTLTLRPMSDPVAAIHWYGKPCGEARINMERAFRALGIDHQVGKLEARWNDAENRLEIPLPEATEAICA